MAEPVSEVHPACQVAPPGGGPEQQPDDDAEPESAGQGGPPVLKTMPSANSSIAIEQLLGLSSGSSPPTADRPEVGDQPSLRTIGLEAAAPAARCSSAQPALQDQLQQPALRTAPPMVLAVPSPPEAGLYASRPQPPRPISAPDCYPPLCPPQQCSPLPSPVESTLGGAAVESPATVIMAGAAPTEFGAWAPGTPHCAALNHCARPVPEAPPAQPVEVPASASTAKAAERPTSSRKGREVVPWRPSEDSTILQGVSDYGCKWSLIAQQLPGRSENAVRNRWHRLENAEQTRRKAIEAGLPVEGYRCRKCGHFKKGHMCLGLEMVPPPTAAVGLGGLGLKRAHHEMAPSMSQPMAQRHLGHGRVYHPMQHAMPHMPPSGRDGGASPLRAMTQPQMMQPVYYYAEEPPPKLHLPQYPQQRYRQPPPHVQHERDLPQGPRPPPLQQYQTRDGPQLSPSKSQPPAQAQAQPQEMPRQQHERSTHPAEPAYYLPQYGSQQPTCAAAMPQAPIMIGQSGPPDALRRYVRGEPFRMAPIEAPRHGAGYSVDGTLPASPATEPMSLGLGGFSEDVMEAFLQGTLYREEA